MNPRSPTVRRQTRQRRSIYEAVAATNSHPTAEWVYEHVRRSLPRISLGTVYRNLQLLVGEGKLKAWSRGRTTRFDADVAVHDHFVCDACGLLLDVEQTPETLAAEKKLRARGHIIETRVLEFHGFCRDCRPGRNPNPRTTSSSPRHNIVERNQPAEENTRKGEGSTCLIRKTL